MSSYSNYSPLCSYVNVSSGKYGLRGGNKISKITIHYAKSILSTFQYVMNQINGPGNYSFHYAILNDGKIGQFVLDSNRSWGTGNEDNDLTAINILVSNDTSTAPYSVSRSAVESLIKLCEDVCKRHSISFLRYTGDLQSSNVTLHRWFDSSTDCPGSYVENMLPALCSSVNLKLQSIGSQNLGQDYYSSVSKSISYLSRSYDLDSVRGQGTLSLDQIDPKKLSPYILQVNRNTSISSMNAAKLKSLGVSGGIVEVGRLWDDAGLPLPQKDFVNPNLDFQIKSVKSKGLEYGLIILSRATTVDQAKQEASYLRYEILKHMKSAYLGVWVERNVVCPYSINNRIIQYLQNYLKEMGLAKRIGLKCSSWGVSNMNWNLFSNDWALWLEKGAASLSELDAILYPSYFKV